MAIVSAGIVGTLVGGIGGGATGLLTATIEDAAKSDIVLTFSDFVTATTPATDWTYSVNGGIDTAPTAVISGTVLTLTMGTPIVFGDTVTVNYADATSDMAIGGVQLEAITDSAVTNNVVEVIDDVTATGGTVNESESFTFAGLGDMTGLTGLVLDGVACTVVVFTDVANGDGSASAPADQVRLDEFVDLVGVV